MSTAPGSYLRYLPAIYAEQAAPFLASYLDIFRKLLTGLDDEQLDARKGIQELLSAEVIGTLFHPRFSFLFPGDATPMPPISGLKPADEATLLARFDSYIGVPAATPDAKLRLGAATSDPQAPFLAWLGGLLDWLAGWVDLVLKTDWSVDKKRLVIAQSMALQRARGTAQGLGWLVNSWFDLPLTLTGTSRTDPAKSLTGPLTVSVANPVTRGVTLADRAGTPQTFVLAARGSADDPLVSGYAPWVFNVVVTLPSATVPDFVPTAHDTDRIRALLAQLRTMLERLTPVGTHYRMTVLPGLRLGNGSADLGVNTLL